MLTLTRLYFLLTHSLPRGAEARGGMGRTLTEVVKEALLDYVGDED